MAQTPLSRGDLKSARDRRELRFARQAPSRSRTPGRRPEKLASSPESVKFVGRRILHIRPRHRHARHNQDPRPRRQDQAASASRSRGEHAAAGSARRERQKPRAKIEVNSELLAYAHVSKAWPFEEARKVLSRLKRLPKPTGAIIFETGYGPSGLPHIGTFGEVARTTMVRHAFRVLTEDKVPTRLICFSDDMDGLRKVPDNIPNKEMLAEHLGKPLTQVPDPFGDHPSFGQHNNARLRAFLDTFGFDYEFLSATECYRAGRFDATLLKVLAHYDAIRDVMLPTLGPERRATYSPFLPISPETGHVLQVPIIERDLAAGTDLLQGAGDRQAHAGAGHRRPLQAAMEGRLGHALGGARRRLRDGGQGSDRIRCGSPARSAAFSARSRPKASTTSCSSTRTARRSPSRAATASPSRNGSLRLAGEPVALHVSEPAEGEAALFRRDPPRRRRICRPPRRLSEGGAGREAR